MADIIVKIVAIGYLTFIPFILLLIHSKLSDIHYVLEESVEDMSDGPEQLDLFNGEY